MRAPRILVVDDSLADRTSIRVAFEKSGFPVCLSFAVNGQAALDLLRGPRGKPLPPKPHLMMVDIKMPGISGLDLLGLLKKDPTLGRIPVIIFSGSDDPRDILAAYQNFASGYVPKPVSMDRLARVVELVGGLCTEALAFPELQD